MLTIGFDAKRLFHNGTGLGNYSRSLVKALHTCFPQNTYALFSPSITYNEESYYFTKHFPVITPGMFSKIAWRSHGIIHSLVEHNIDIYHGLSHEIPFGIEGTNIKTVVTIHDIIYKFFPQDFPLIDKKIYDIKWQHACNRAHAIIATSQATKNDIITHFNVPQEKIHVVYQTCSEEFEQTCSLEVRNETLAKFQLPDSYLLYVGAISERKNLLSIVQAYHQAKKTIAMPLVVIGNGRSYLQKIKTYIEKHSLQNDILFLHNVENADLPALYQSAYAFLYPSKYEGFGIPLVEAMKCNTPIITSNISCMPEIAGNAALLVDPYSIDDIAQGMTRLCTDKTLYNELRANCTIQAEKFSFQKFAHDTMSIYKHILY